MNILAIMGSYRKGRTIDTLVVRAIERYLDRAYKLGKRLSS